MSPPGLRAEVVGMTRDEGSTASLDESTDTGFGKPNRRTLLKGAVAAGVGIAAYSAPVISTVPAYAQTGLGTQFVQSGDICIGFSPNHQSSIGDWHVPADVANVFDSNFSGTDYSDHDNAPSTKSTADPIRVQVFVGGIARELQFGGHFNNWSGTTNGEYTVDGWNGGGIFFNLLDSNCQMLIVGWYSSTTADATDCTETLDGGYTLMGSSNAPIHSGGVNPGTAPPNNVPNPFLGGTGPKYFHSGKPRKGTGWVGGVRFRIQCSS
jgi:hypothetical protein